MLEVRLEVHRQIRAGRKAGLEQQGVPRSRIEVHGGLCGESELEQQGELQAWAVELAEL